MQLHSINLNFRLAYKDNATLIYFPSYGDLVVKSISYDVKRLDLLNPKHFIHEVFLNLDLYLTYFGYYYVVKNYTYLSCSSRLSLSFTEVPCLNGFEYHVYTIEPFLSLIDSYKLKKNCKKVRISIGVSNYSKFDIFWSQNQNLNSFQKMT